MVRCRSGNFRMLASCGGLCAIERDAEARRMAASRDPAGVETGCFPASISFEDRRFGRGVMSDVLAHVYLFPPREFGAEMQALNAFLYWIFFSNVLPPEVTNGGGEGG